MAIFDCNKVNLKKGSKGEEVKTLQTHLHTLGYYNSTIDGSYGDVTVGAVKKLQKAMGGLKQDGWFGPSTCKKFNTYMESKGNPSSVDIKTFDCPNIVLKRGHKGDNVKLLQTMLKTLGYYTREIDGDFGMYTEQAVKAFQTKTSHTPDGVFGPKTCPDLNKQYTAKMKAGITNKYHNPPALTNVKPVLTLLPEYVVLPEEALIDEESGESETAEDGESGEGSNSASKTSTATKIKVKTGGTITTTANFDCPKINLSQGSKGENVKKLQNILKSRGFYTRQVDGDFGKYTKEAVKKLQQVQGNSQDGVFGPKTCTSLQKGQGSTAQTKAHTVTAITSISTSDDMEGLAHEITIKMLYKPEYHNWIRRLQKTKFVLEHGDDKVYDHEGYINEVKINQENDVMQIELSIVGYTVFLDKNVTYEKTAKRSELLKELIEMAGLKPDIDMTGMDDSEYTVKVTKTATGTSGDGGGGLVQASGNDCTPTNPLSSYSYELSKTSGDKIIGNSSANYAQDTKSMSGKAAILDLYNRFVYYKPKYWDNRWCPQKMWRSSGKVTGNCADIARLVKCLGDVHGLKVGIHHMTDHYYNLIEVNGKVYRFDCCCKSSGSYHGETTNNLNKRGGPWC